MKVYGTWQNLPIVDKSLVATAQASPEVEGGGVLLGILGGGVPDPISDQKMSFSIPVFTRDLKNTYPFSDLDFRQKLCHHYLD